MARSQVATPSHLIDGPVYSELVRAGFRRSGAFTYRPYCDHCRACVPVRIAGRGIRSPRARSAAPGAATGRSRPRCSISSTAPSTTRSTCATSRGATPAAAWTRTAASSTAISCSRATCDSRLIEFRENGVLRMVSIVDELQDGLSSVYTFFDPDIARRELRHLQHPVADRAVPQARPALSLSRLLDRAEPQDGLQDPVPADAGPDRRPLAAGRAISKGVIRDW